MKELKDYEYWELVEELRRREEVKFHYVDEGMVCTIESNEFDGEIEGSVILLEVKDY